MYKRCFNVFSVDFETKTVHEAIFKIKGNDIAFQIHNSTYPEMYLKFVQR